MSLILIIEDNDKNLKLVRDVLQVKGYATIEALNAEDGLVLARERKPDLVLMDIQLPGMNGIEALGVLRADPGTAGIPVVAVTASVLAQDCNSQILVFDVGGSHIASSLFDPSQRTIGRIHSLPVRETGSPEEFFYVF